MPMIRNQQFPWLYQQIVLMEIDLLRAARPKQTVYGERRPEAGILLLRYTCHF